MFMEKLQDGWSYDRFVGMRREDIARSPIDIFSLAHLIMGQLLYVTIYAIVYLCADPYIADAIAFAITILVGVFWEVLENYVLFNHNLKFENRRDTLINSLFDVLFVVLGSLMMLFSPYFWVDLLLISAEYLLFINFVILSSEFLALAMYFTLKRGKKPSPIVIELGIE